MCFKLTLLTRSHYLSDLFTFRCEMLPQFPSQCEQNREIFSRINPFQNMSWGTVM